MNCTKFHAALPLLAAAVTLAGCAPLQKIPGPSANDASAGPAMQAACTPLLDALRQARSQPEVSQYLVDAGLFPVVDRPMATRSGDLIREVENGQAVTRLLEPGQDPLIEALQVELARGRAWCRDDGEANHHGVTTRRISFRYPDLPDWHQPVSVLIDTRTRLPLWHGYASMDGGFAWVYGAEAPKYPPRSTLRAAQ